MYIKFDFIKGVMWMADWIQYDRTSGTKVMTTAQKNTIHQAYRRYAKRVFREAQQRIRGKYDSEDRTYEVRFSTGAFINSDEYQKLAVVQKNHIKFTTDQKEKIAKKTATLLRKDKFKVFDTGYGNLELYKK